MAMIASLIYGNTFQNPRIPSPGSEDPVHTVKSCLMNGN